MWMNRWKQTTNTTAHLHTRKTEGSGRRGGILWEKKMVFTKRKKKIALLVLSSGYDTYGHNHQIDACGSSFYASDTWLVRGVLCKTVPGDNGGHIKPSNDVKKLAFLFFKKSKTLHQAKRSKHCHYFGFLYRRGRRGQICWQVKGHQGQQLG